MKDEANKPPMTHDEAMDYIISTCAKGKAILSYEEAILAYVRLRGFLRDGAALLASPPESGDWSPEPVLVAVKRTLADHRAWIKEPDHDVALSIALIATIAVSNELTRGLEFPAAQPDQVAAAASAAEEIATEHRRRKQARESLIRVSAAVLGEIEQLDAQIAKGGEA